MTQSGKPFTFGHPCRQSRLPASATPSHAGPCSLLNKLWEPLQISPHQITPDLGDRTVACAQLAVLHSLFCSADNKEVYI